MYCTVLYYICSYSYIAQSHMEGGWCTDSSPLCVFLSIMSLFLGCTTFSLRTRRKGVSAMSINILIAIAASSTHHYGRCEVSINRAQSTGTVWDLFARQRSFLCRSSHLLCRACRSIPSHPILSQSFRCGAVRCSVLWYGMVLCYLSDILV